MVRTRGQIAHFKRIDLIDAVCDIEDPVLFQAVLTRLKSMLDEDKWQKIGYKLASLSPRSFIVALAAGECFFTDQDAKRLHWMLRDPNPYILNHPTMMHEVRALNLIGMPTFPSSLHHFTSLRKLHWHSYSSLLPDDAFSLLRQHMTGLQELHFETRRLTAPMHNDIAQMTNLESLGLAAHDFDAMPPLGNLRGLKTLKIWDYHRRDEALISNSTLDGLTRIERLSLMTQLSENLPEAIPVMFPSLRYLRVFRWYLSQNAVASLRSHYKNKEGFKLDILGF